MHAIYAKDTQFLDEETAIAKACSIVDLCNPKFRIVIPFGPGKFKTSIYNYNRSINEFISVLL